MTTFDQDVQTAVLAIKRTELLAELGKRFARHSIKQRPVGGGRVVDYVEGETVIRRLNATAGEWSFAVKSLEWRGELLICVGTLTIPSLGARDGIGVQHASGGEDVLKGAATDALKKAATLFGVALELYGPDLEALEAGEVAPPAGASPGERTFNATDKQIGKIGALCKDLGWDVDALRGAMRERYGVESRKLLTVAQAKDFIDWLQTQMPAQQPALT